MTTADDLRRLVRLHQSGALSDDEFATQKAALLAAHSQNTDESQPSTRAEKFAERVLESDWWNETGSAEATRSHEDNSPRAGSTGDRGRGEGAGALADGLSRLVDLHQAGALSDDEFAAAKAAILSDSGPGQVYRRTSTARQAQDTPPARDPGSQEQLSISDAGRMIAVVLAALFLGWTFLQFALDRFWNDRGLDVEITNCGSYVVGRPASGVVVNNRSGSVDVYVQIGWYEGDLKVGDSNDNVTVRGGGSARFVTSPPFVEFDDCKIDKITSY